MTTSAFGVGGLAAVVLYLLVLLCLGVAARRARRGHAMGDFYLAGRGLGSVVLFATLYATQYSGNSFLGYPGEAHRIGYAWVMSVGFMTAIVVAYLLFAPQLYAASRRLTLVTPGDWIAHRFGSAPLTLAANLVLVAAISNYLLAQLMAMGHVVEGLSAGAVPYWAGVVGLTLVVIVYGTLGGMRAVAWTDVAQGALLMVGLGGILIAVVPSPSHMAGVTTWIASAAPEKVAVPDAATCITWMSTLLLIGISGAVYPHAIQRIYAARSAAALKRSVSAMVWMPILTMVPLFLIGVISLQELAALEGIAADQVMPMMLARWASTTPLLYAASLAVMLAVIAAIMSTADSVLLTLSSIIAKDFIGRGWLRDAPDARLTWWGKLSAWAIVAGLVAVALVPRITLWGLIELKMEILMQISPLFILGVRWSRLTAPAALSGMVVGLAVAFGLPLLGHSRPLGIHDGTLGWLANLCVCVVLSHLLPARQPQAVTATQPAVARLSS